MINTLSHSLKLGSYDKLDQLLDRYVPMFSSACLIGETPSHEKIVLLLEYGPGSAQLLRVIPWDYTGAIAELGDDDQLRWIGPVENGHRAARLLEECLLEGVWSVVTC